MPHHNTLLLFTMLCQILSSGRISSRAMPGQLACVNIRFTYIHVCMHACMHACIRRPTWNNHTVHTPITPVHSCRLYNSFVTYVHPLRPFLSSLKEERSVHVLRIVPLRTSKYNFQITSLRVTPARNGLVPTEDSEVWPLQRTTLHPIGLR